MKTVTSKDSQDPHAVTEATPAPPEELLTRAPTAKADQPPHSEAPAAPTDTVLHVAPPQPPVATPTEHRFRKGAPLGRHHRCAAGRRLLSGSVGGNRVEHGEHGGRLRQRPRDPCGPPGNGPGEEGAGG